MLLRAFLSLLIDHVIIWYSKIKCNIQRVTFNAYNLLGGGTEIEIKNIMSSYKLARSAD